jgi:hypothetical protein
MRGLEREGCERTGKNRIGVRGRVDVDTSHLNGRHHDVRLCFSMPTHLPRQHAVLVHQGEESVQLLEDRAL